MATENKKNKNVFVTFLGILLLLCSLCAVTFAIFIFKDTSNYDNTITTGTISFSYNEDSNGIDLNNAIPIDDSVGKMLTQDSRGVNQGYFDFSIKGKAQNVGYQIYATMEEGSNMDPNYVKVYLTDENDNAYKNYKGEVPTYGQLENYENNSKSKLLYTGAIHSDSFESKKFRLRLWIAKDYTDGSSSKEFKIKINVKATA